MPSKQTALKFWAAEKEKRRDQLLVGILTDDFERKALWWKGDLNTLIDHLNACLRGEQLLASDYGHTVVLQTASTPILNMFWEQVDITLWWGSGIDTGRFEMYLWGIKNDSHPIITLLDATEPEKFAEEGWNWYEWDEQGRPSGMNRRDTRIPPEQQEAP